MDAAPVALVVLVAAAVVVTGLLVAGGRRRSRQQGRPAVPAALPADRTTRRPGPALQIRDLPPAHRRRFTVEWQQVQEDAVTRPDTAVDAAQALAIEVLRERGYAVDDVETDVADHASVMGHYRSARRISALNDRGEATTNQLREALVHYRWLFDRLLGPPDGPRADQRGPTRHWSPSTRPPRRRERS
ncbi:MAG: hypothetical protein ACLGIG_01955 [Actinomycetes bacterium]